MPTPHDLVVLGGGPAGTAAALAARRRGLDVVLVEARQRSAREVALFALADDLAVRPLRLAPAERRGLGFRQAIRRAGEVAAAAVDQRDQLLARRGVERVAGHATLTGKPGEVVVATGSESGVIHSRHVLLASGATPRLAGGTLPEGDIRGALLDEREPPKSAVVVGGGREGVMLAGLFAAAGTSVTLIERTSRLLRLADIDVAAAVKRALESSGARVMTEKDVLGIDALQDGARVVRGEGLEVGPVELALVTVGRAPDLGGLGLDLSGVVRLPMPTQRYDTALPWLWIAGAAAGRPISAEAARREGRAVVSRAFGGGEHVPYHAIPHVVGGPASAGWVGLTEAEAAAAGHSLLIGRARMPGRGAQLPGFIKLLASASSQRLLGIHAVGAGSREVVGLASALLELGASRADLAAMAFSVGSPSEALVEAAAAAA